MNEKTSGHRLGNLSPVILRLGIAAALALHGIRQFNTPSNATGDSAVGDNVVPSVVDAKVPPVAVPAPAQGAEGVSFTQEGVSVETDWTQVVGVAEIVAAAMLVLGFLTRLTTFGLLCAAGYAGLMPGGGSSEGILAKLGDILPDAGDPTLLLLAGACFVLLMSGCGHAGLDKHVFHRHKRQPDLTTP